ncbi:MAG: hypothetical protein GTO18_08335 [Anaerolineales bacterium]|nr:hypothetical protein [Anaerolineales bacterium]
MSKRLPQPRLERISVLTILVLLTYGLIRMIELPTVAFEAAILGLLIEVDFETQSLFLILAAALAAAGTNWLIMGHPYSKYVRHVENWVIPTFAAVAIGVFVIRIPPGPFLWLGVVLGALLLVIVFTAEFIVSFPRDPRYELVAIGLNGLAFLLLAAAFFAIFALQLRAIFAIPLVFVATFLITWRLLRLSYPDVRLWLWALIIAVIAAQIATGLHYLPLVPLRVSLLLGVTVYLSYQFILSHLRRELKLGILVEYIVVGMISLVAIFTLT